MLPIPAGGMGFERLVGKGGRRLDIGLLIVCQGKVHLLFALPFTFLMGTTGMARHYPFIHPARAPDQKGQQVCHRPDWILP